MNCKDFESVVLELDRDEGASVAALEHAAACSGCGEELEAIAELRASLAAIARQDAQLEAPAHIEAALVKRLREGQAPRNAGFNAPRLISRPRLRLALAAAAVIALIVTAASIVYLRSASRNSTMTGKGPVQPPVREVPKDSGADQPVAPAPKKGAVPPGRLRSGQRELLGRTGEPERKKPSTEGQRGATSNDPSAGYEIATDYFPIGYGSFLQPVDSGQIVRIKLPRSALRSYGLPVDPLHADEAVKADVVIGNDGMARAIRFVH